MRIGPKYKICKRLGAHVFEQCQTKSFSLSAQRADQKSGGKRKSSSDFNRQLLEKQKLRLTYSLTERQFSSYVKAALASGENPTQHLFSNLESRLDSVLYRAGFASTRRAARQLAAHGHFEINNRRVTIPSYRLAVGDTVRLRDGSRSSALFQIDERLKEHRPPSWIACDAEKRECVLHAAPQWGTQDSVVDFGAVFEYYTR